MPEAWIVGALRTPIARANPETGAFRHRRPDELAADLLSSLMASLKTEPSLLEDIYLGCARQAGEQGYNIARQAVLIAGFPPSVCGVTLNRNCGSSLEAIHQAARAIQSKSAELLIAGGVEHMHRVAWETKPNLGPGMLRLHASDSFHMGLVCEHLGKSRGITRQEQDAFAHRSQEKAWAAAQEGKFLAEIAPTWGHGTEGQAVLVADDQTIRKGSTLEALAKLEPVFLKDGTITSGNASPLSAGAAALLLASESKARELSLAPLAKVAAMAVVGVDPLEMGLGPVPAIQKILQTTGLRLQDIGIIEINEAFASQTLAVLKDLGLDPERVNLQGGAIALGHPLGATGARMAVSAVHAMRRDKVKFALLALCVGGGQGMATLLELAT